MKRAVAFCVTALFAVLIGAGPALAETVTIRKIDTSDFPDVKVLVQVGGKAPTLDQFGLREDGRLVSDRRIVPIGETATPVGIVLVIDTSGSMRATNKLEAARAAAKQFVAQKRPNDRVAIVSFSASPLVLSNFTADTALLNHALDGLTAAGETALWDAVRLGSGLFADAPELQPNMVVLSDGADTASTASARDARTAAIGANAAVYAVGLIGGEFDTAGLTSLASDTGGQYVETNDPGRLVGLYQQVQQAIQNQYEITYRSQAQSVVNVTLTVADGEAKASAPIGSTASGATTNQPDVVGDSAFPSFLSGTAGKFLIVVLALVAAGLLAYALLQLAMRSDQSTLQSALRPYEEERLAGVDDHRPDSLAESALIRRAVDTTARIARERGVLDALEKKLEQADLPLRPAEALFFTVVLGVLIVIVAAALGKFVGFLVALASVVLVPLGTLNFLAGRRRRKFGSQLPDMLQLLAGSLRAGYSLLQGVDAVAQEVSDPMGQELRRVLAEARLGRPLEDALEEAAERMASADFSWAVMAVGIQREVGGNLAELLDTVADTMIHRERLRREVRALTAEGRVSAIILGLLPVGLGMMMWVMNRDYISRLFNHGVGQAMLGGSVVLAVFGFVWMKKIVDIEI